MRRKKTLSADAPHLIDEWLDVPAIWDAVRHEIDRRGKKGQFILTSSATVSEKEKERPRHSGAGRIARLRMRPMSLYESGHSSGQVSLREIMYGNIEPMMVSEIRLEQLASFIIDGGWPEGGSRLVADEYIKALLEADIFKIDGVRRDPHRMTLLLRSLARNESTTCPARRIWQDINGNDYDNQPGKPTASVVG